MSPNRLPTLHLEWMPDRVRALDRATGRSAEGVSLAELRTVTEGHRDAIVGVGRGAVFLKTVRLPRASDDDLRRLVAVRLAALFPLPADQLAFDAIQSADQSAEGALTLVAAIRASDLARLRDDLQQAGLRAVRVLPVALAAAVALGRGDGLVVEETTTGLALDVVQGGVLRFSRLAPPGSDRQIEAQRTLAAAGSGDLTLHSGMALRHLHETPAFSFALSAERERAARQRVAGRTRLAFLMVLAGLLLMALIWADRGDALIARKKAEGAWAKELGKRRSLRDAENRKAQRAVSVETTLTRAFAQAQPLSDLTAVVGDSLPAGAWLVGLSLERGKPVQIRGTARTADEVAKTIEALGANPRFRDVKLVFANTARIEETPVVQFSIAATAVGNLPLPAPERRKTKSTRARATGATR